MGNNQIPLSKSSESSNVYPPHPMLNNTQLIKRNNEMFLRSQWPFFNQDTYIKWTKNYQSFLQKAFDSPLVSEISHPILDFLVLPLKYNYQKVNVCSPSGIVTIEYFPLEHTLVDDIQRRSKNNEPYIQQELWILLRTMTKVVVFLHQKDISIGDLRCQNIFINLVNKNIRIATQVSWIGQWSLTSKIENKWEIFATPELLDSIANRKQLTSDLLKNNDDFQVGMVLAEGILLEDLSKIYEYKSQVKILSKQKHQQLIEKLMKVSYYSSKLLLLVVGLIQYDQNDRISSTELYDLLKLKQKQTKTVKVDHLTKEYFLRSIPQKYNKLQSKISSLKGNSSMYSFQGMPLIKHNGFTIHEISNVPVRKTVDDTSVDSFYSLLKDEKTHRTIMVEQKYKPSQEFHQNQTNYKQHSNMNHNTGRTIRFDKYSQHRPQFRLDDVIAMSDNKDHERPIFNMPSSDAKQIVPTKLYNEQENSKVISQNFSFHNLIPENEKKRSAIEITDSIEQIKSTQTLLITPSVYSVSNPPESYISYHYTKSISQNEQPKIKDDSKSYETSFNFEPQIPLSYLKKNSENRPSNLIAIEFNTRRRTTSGGIWEKQPIQDLTAL